MGITIPPKFVERLNEIKTGDGQSWLARIETFNGNVQKVFDASTEYFAHYTEHGASHIQKVLEIAERLIPDHILARMTEPNLGVLLMSIAAHDIGMFIHAPGLRILLTQPEWAERWEEYRKELRNMPDGRMNALFGEYKEKGDKAELPEAQKLNVLSKWQDKLCSEFLRRYHHLLAQEIILNGFPIRVENGSPVKLNLFSGVDDYKKHQKLIALVARSHQEDLDAHNPLDISCGNYDQTRPGELSRIPVYYLMAVLRLADYLDAGCGRASWVREAICDVDNETSIREFTWNRYVERLEEEDWSVKDMRLSVRVAEVDDQDQPITSTVFQKIEAWLWDVQRELDICWRYLSLYYEGNQAGGWQLSIRELTSNALQTVGRGQFAEKIVLERARLAARAEVLNLLTAPLYDENPSYGVRELLQNAVDACRERKALEGDAYEGLVRVILDKNNGKPTITFQDNGVGMTKEIILQYYLIAGGTFRKSDQWRKQYEGKQVYRSGRFGVGVLAAFLLGPTVHVETLPRGARKGYAFTLRENRDEDIDIEFKDFSDDDLYRLGRGGTRVRVELSQDAADVLWKAADRDSEIKHVREAAQGNNRSIRQPCGYGVRDSKSELRGVSPFAWYWHESPKVIYTIDGQDIPNPYQLNKAFSWLELSDGLGFDALWWRPATNQNSMAWCNGVKIPWGVDVSNSWMYASLLRDQRYRMQLSLSLMDSKGAASINLARTRMRISKEQEERIYGEQVKLMLAFMMLVHIQQHYAKRGRISIPYVEEADSNVLGGRHQWFILSHQGYLIDDERFYSCLENEIIWDVSEADRGVFFDIKHLKQLPGPITIRDPLQSTVDIDALDNGVRQSSIASIEAIYIASSYLNKYMKQQEDHFIWLGKAKQSPRRTIEIGSRLNPWLDGGLICVDRMVKWAKTSAEKEFFIFAATGDYPQCDIPDYMFRQFDLMVGYRLFARPHREKSTMVIDDIFRRYFGEASDPWIPYDLKERKRKFPRFFDPNDEIYQYMRYVSDNFSGEGFYRL